MTDLDIVFAHKPFQLSSYHHSPCLFHHPTANLHVESNTTSDFSYSVDELTLSLDLDTYKEDQVAGPTEELRDEDSQQFSSELYDRAESFLDQEGLHLICPDEVSNPRSLKNFVQLRRLPSLRSDDTHDINTDDFSSKKGSSFLLKRSLLVQRRTRSAASNLSEFNQVVSHAPLTLPVIEDLELMMGPPPA